MSYESISYTEPVPFPSVIQRIAHEHLDELLGPAEWKHFQLDKYLPDVSADPLSAQFRWSPYVELSPRTGERRIGLKLFHDGRIVDVREFDCLSDLRVSDRYIQGRFDAQSCSLAERARIDHVAQRESDLKVIEGKRGYPAGEYELAVSYQLRNGRRHTLILHNSFVVAPSDTHAAVLSRLTDQVVLTGLHNWGLLVDSAKAYQTVDVRMRHGKETPIRVPLDLDATGHIFHRPDPA